MEFCILEGCIDEAFLFEGESCCEQRLSQQPELALNVLRGHLRKGTSQRSINHGPGIHDHWKNCTPHPTERQRDMNQSVWYDWSFKYFTIGITTSSIQWSLSVLTTYILGFGSASI